MVVSPINCYFSSEGCHTANDDTFSTKVCVSEFLLMAAVADSRISEANGETMSSVSRCYQ